MGVEEHKSKSPKSVKFAVLTVSNTRVDADDFSGKVIIELLTSAGHKLARKVIVKDDIQGIQQALRDFIEDSSVQAIIVNGGTGVAKADVTLEAVAHFEEKQLPGFGELFRTLSHQEIGSAAMMSRASAFVSEGKPVFCIPGSEKAVRLAVTKLIEPELGHLVWEANR
ncbi:MAG: molybdenum cofactor biosynthesis protein [Euryarchaeota archaeon RBG_13_57_23]|nr:MAG: molybdenum cofactor biosynthesis protein [Euryarchaeota archaeon RBG_13_57_23]